jgi:hypothetical protein
MANIARDGAPNSKREPVAAHDGMKHTADDGSKLTGLSRTQSAAILQGDKLPTDRPAIVKVLPKVEPHPAQNPNRTDRGSHVDGLGDALMAEAERGARVYPPNKQQS